MRHILRITSFALLALLALLIASCASKNDNSESAKAIARQWVNNNIDFLGDKLGSGISKDYPAVAGLAIKAAIKNGLTWEYSAYREKTDRWRVIVGTKMDANIPLISKSLKASGDFVLLINTKSSEVIQTEIDPSSFKLTLNATASSTDALNLESMDRPLYVANECNHPIRMWLRYRKSNGDWYITSVYQFAAEEEQSRLRASGNDVLFSGDDAYYYAEATDGSGYVWAGDLERKLENRDDTVKFRRITFAPALKKPLVTLQCSG